MKLKAVTAGLLILAIASMTACGTQTEQVQETTEAQLLGPDEFRNEMLQSVASKEEMTDRPLDKLSPDELSTNIDLAYIIYSNRSVEMNQQNPLIVSAYTTEERDRLWEAYLIQSELDNYAVSINNEGTQEYIVAIVKPKEEYKLKLAESVKLLRSGYVGGLSDSHTMTISETYIKQVGDYFVICMCPDADSFGTTLSGELETMLKRISGGTAQ